MTRGQTDRQTDREMNGLENDRSFTECIAQQ